MMVRKIAQNLSVIESYIDNGCYEEKFNICKLLVFLTRFPEFDKQGYEKGLLEKCCRLIEYF